MRQLLENCDYYLKSFLLFLRPEYPLTEIRYYSNIFFLKICIIYA